MDDTVTIKVERCTMTINLEPFFAESTIGNIRKLFSLIGKEPWNNEEAIGVLLDFLSVKVGETEKAKAKAEAWHAYQNGYVDTKFKPELTPQEKRKIERENKKMYKAVIKAKQTYLRYVKIANIYREYMLTQYNF